MVSGLSVGIVTKKNFLKSKLSMTSFGACLFSVLIAYVILECFMVFTFFYHVWLCEGYLLFFLSQYQLCRFIHYL